MSSSPYNRVDIQQYEEVIKKFIIDGYFIICTTDISFADMVKNTIFKITGERDKCTQTQEFSNVLKLLSKKMNKYKMIVIFVEKYLYGEVTIDKLTYIKDTCPKQCKIICLTSETDKHTLVYMHEMGADNIIVKPVSINSLIEKIAFTINKDDKIKRLIFDIQELIYEGNFEEAEKGLNKIFAKKPDSCIGHMLMGDICIKKKDYTKAEECYITATKTANLFLDPIKRMVSLYKETKQYDKKLKYLLKLDVLSPLNHKRKIEIGATYIELNELEKAEMYFNEGIKSVKRQASEMTSAAHIDIAKQIQNNNPILAMKYINDAIQLKEGTLCSDDLWMFNELGIMMRKQGKWQDAVDCYRRALEIMPAEGSIHYNLAMALLEGSDIPEAITHFELAVKHAPSLLTQVPDTAYNIGVLYLRLGDQDHAKTYFEKCLELDPTHKPSLKALKRN